MIKPPFVVGVLATLAATTVALAPKQCKVTPTSPDWPSPALWSQLNTTLAGVLIAPQPPAAACHPSHPLYNNATCAHVTARWSSSQFHSDDPVSSLWQNRNGYSCLPNGPECDGDGYPLYVVNASRPEHVVHAIKFAKEHNIRVNIKSTGHDFLGRSVQPKSLSIWTHHLRDQKWFQGGYTLHGCGTNIPGNFVEAGSGSQMRDVYRTASRRKLIVIGGESMTVSLGGYLTGGGHSPLSALFGMAADQVVEMKIVLPNGEQIVANECENQDLFWASRGGGGSTFGVVTSFVVRAFPDLPMAIFTGSVFGNKSIDANWDAVTHIHQQWPIRLTPYAIGGYFWGPVTLHKTRGLTFQVIMPNATSDNDLKSKLQPIIDEIGVMTNKQTTVPGAYRYYKSFGEWKFPKTPPWPANSTSYRDDSTYFPGNGVNKLITSWLWDAKALASPNLKDALKGTGKQVEHDPYIWSNFVGGPGTKNPPFLRPGGNAINPAWRGAVVRPAIELQWSGHDTALLKEREQALKEMYTFMRNLAPSAGAYSNEADVETATFATDFFGEYYHRLLAIKKRIDPDNVLWCRACVGSEDWIDNEHGELCRKQ